jgi:hypothetical protein
LNISITAFSCPQEKNAEQPFMNSDYHNFSTFQCEELKNQTHPFSIASLRKMQQEGNTYPT